MDEINCSDPEIKNKLTNKNENLIEESDNLNSEVVEKNHTDNDVNNEDQNGSASEVISNRHKEFTSEEFKIDLHGVPKYFGVRVSAHFQDNCQLN